MYKSVKFHYSGGNFAAKIGETYKNVVGQLEFSKWYAISKMAVNNISEETAELGY